jgi:hypothetical protein
VIRFEDEGPLVLPRSDELEAEAAGEEVSEEKGVSFVRKVIPWLVILCLIGILGLVGIVVYQVMTGQLTLF